MFDLSMGCHSELRGRSVPVPKVDTWEKAKRVRRKLVKSRRAVPLNTLWDRQRSLGKGDSPCMRNDFICTPFAFISLRVRFEPDSITLTLLLTFKG